MPLDNSSTTTHLPISPAVWKSLVETNKRAQWARPGVFGTGVGPDYIRNGATLLYIGKSAGPLGERVGSCFDQAESCLASTEWMIGRRNLSAFWQFVDVIDPSRGSIAWTNICKMDRMGGERPPSDSEWSEVASICMTALGEEMKSLSPKVTVFATSKTFKTDVDKLLSQLLYVPISLPFNDGWTSCSKSPDGKFVIQIKHPQGWDRASRDRVITLVMKLISGGVPE